MFVVCSLRAENVVVEADFVMARLEERKAPPILKSEGNHLWGSSTTKKRLAQLKSLKSHRKEASLTRNRNGRIAKIKRRNDAVRLGAGV